VRQSCYSEDGKVVLGRVFVFHGIRFTAMFGEMVLLTYSGRTTAFDSRRLDGPGVGPRGKGNRASKLKNIPAYLRASTPPICC